MDPGENRGFTETEILEMLYEMSLGRAVAFSIGYQDEEGNRYELRIPVEREKLEEMLRRKS